MAKTSPFFKNIIWNSLILTKKINFSLDNSSKGPFSVQKLVKISQKKPNLGVIVDFLP